MSDDFPCCKPAPFKPAPIDAIQGPDMNHKHLAEDHYDSAIHSTNAGITERHLARATYHATMAQLETLDTLVALLSPVNAGNTVSIEQLRAEAGL